MNRALVCLILALGSNAVACGDPAEETPPLETESPAPPEPEVQQPADPPLLVTARAARGTGYAARYQSGAQANPARHYFFGGEARFVFHDTNQAPRAFDFDVALAGPNLQRYQLADGQRKNWFLLGGPGDAWLKTPEDTSPRPNSAGAGELGEDAALRWLILGFPASLEHPAARDQAEQWSSLWSQGEPIPLAEDFGRGGLQLRLDAETGLPLQVERRQEEGDAQILLAVSDWTLSYQGNQGERIYPSRWDWHRENWVLEETVEELEDRALYLDTAFRPKEAPLSTYQVRRGSDGSTQRVPEERFALVSYSMRFRALTEQPVPGSPARVWEVREDGASRFIEQLEDEAEGEGVESLDEQLCLLWSTPQSTSLDAEADARLREVAAQNGFEVIGPVWISTEVAGLEVLLPVRQPD